MKQRTKNINKFLLKFLEREPKTIRQILDGMNENLVDGYRFWVDSEIRPALKQLIKENRIEVGTQGSGLDVYRKKTTGLLRITQGSISGQIVADSRYGTEGVWIDKVNKHLPGRMQEDAVQAS